MLTESGFVFSCFNCGFKAGSTWGSKLTINAKMFLKWIGMTDQDINKLDFDSLRNNTKSITLEKKLDLSLPTVELPENSRPIKDLLAEHHTDIRLDLVIQYIKARGMTLDWHNWHWSPSPGYSDRLLIPFYHDNRIVGWTGRKITTTKVAKYLTSSHPGYVFNLSAQPLARKYCIVVEGQLDAIAIDGVGIMHNKPTDTQCARLNSLNKEIIIVPDRDSAGATIITAALNNQWSISCPPWESHIKDVADAQKQYGRLYTLQSILHYKESNPIKIKIMQRQLENTR
jgi:5S rRNA maturation endonuclease (ribonuclease M5)